MDIIFSKEEQQQILEALKKANQEEFPDITSEDMEKYNLQLQKENLAL